MFHFTTFGVCCVRLCNACFRATKLWISRLIGVILFKQKWLWLSLWLLSFIITVIGIVVLWSVNIGLLRYDTLVKTEIFYCSLLRSTQPSSLLGMAKWLSAFGTIQNGMVGIEDSRWQADSQFKSFGLVWRSTCDWCCLTLIIWTGMNSCNDFVVMMAPWTCSEYYCCLVTCTCRHAIGRYSTGTSLISNLPTRRRYRLCLWNTGIRTMILSSLEVTSQVPW